jgi:SAM-dependent methyltransferase
MIIAFSSSGGHFMSNIQSDLYLAFTEDPGVKVDFIHWLAIASGLPDDLELLDIGSGPGQLLPFYAALGWRVTGMEPDAGFYEAARERCTKNGIRMLNAGFRHLDLDHRFDLICGTNAPFSYLLTREEQLDALRKCNGALKPGGVLFLDCPNFLWHLNREAALVQKKSIIRNREITLTRSIDFDYHDATAWLHDRYEWHVTEDIIESIERTDTMAILTVPYLLNLLRCTGFTHIITYREYSSRSAGRITGKNILISGRKGGSKVRSQE